MFAIETSAIERRNSEDMHRQSSRSTANVDAVDCLVNTSDLALENEVINHESKQQRRSDSSRRDQPSKRSHESSAYRATLHSAPSVTRKRHSSPLARSQYPYNSAQRHHRVASPIPSPPPPPPPSSSSSRHHRHGRQTIAVKRPHSRSPSERRPPTHRSRVQTSKEPIDDGASMLTSTSEDQSISRKTDKISSNQEIGDLSLISEDELTKVTDIRPNRTTSTNEVSSKTTNNKLHSTPSVRSNANDSVLDMSNIAQEYDISLFPNSTLSTTHANSILTTSVSNANELLQAMDLISRYKTMQSLKCTDPQISACEKDILKIIQKKIELQKIEVDHCERAIKLRQRELAEREKRFQQQLTDTAGIPAVPVAPPVLMELPIVDVKPQQEQRIEIISNQETKKVPQEESAVKSSPASVDTVNVTLTSKNGHEQATVTRKNGAKSRFSKAIVDPSIFPSRENPKVDLYSDDNDDDQSSTPLNTNNSVKKATISKILAPSESMGDTDLKVTSSNSCRIVEFQSGTTDKTASNKGPSHDLRLTLSKNRSKQADNDDYGSGSNGSRVISDDDQTMTISKTITSKPHSNKDDKQQSYDYHSQRSVTSASHETIIDNTQDKRDNRRHQQQQQQQQQQRTSSSRQQQQQYSGHSSSSATNNTTDRSYSHAPVSSQSKYGSNQKRHENVDLRSRLFDPKPSKPSRTTHRNNY